MRDVDIVAPVIYLDCNREAKQVYFIDWEDDHVLEFGNPIGKRNKLFISSIGKMITYWNLENLYIESKFLYCLPFILLSFFSLYNASEKRIQITVNIDKSTLEF